MLSGLVLASALSAFVGPDKGQLPGVVTAEGDVTGRLEIRAEGFADVATKRAMATNTVFWIASNTKGIAAATFLSLMDEGKIALDDPVEKYLPEWKTCTVQATGKAPKRRPTLRMMLSHTAGLPFFVLNPGGKSCTIDKRTVRELSRLGAATPLTFEPGEGYDYSNWGVDVAMAAIEVVTGRPFEEEMKRRVLDPLGMHDTGMIPSAEQMTRLAKSYKLSDDQPPEDVIICQFTAPYTAKTRKAEAGGGLFSTAPDLAKFFRMVASNGLKPDGTRLLSEKAMNEWFTRQTPKGNSNSYSFGMCVWGDSLSHGGSYGTAGSANRKAGTYRIWLVSAEGGNAGSKSARSAWDKR